MKVHIVKARVIPLVMALLVSPSLPLSAFAQSPPTSPEPAESTPPGARPAPVVSGPSSATIPPPQPGSSSVRHNIAFVAAGVAIAAAGSATIFGVLALDNKRAYERSPTYANADTGNDDAAYADGAIAVAVAAGVTSLVLALTRDHDSSELASPKPSSTSGSTAVVASPIVVPHGAGVGAVLRF